MESKKENNTNRHALKSSERYYKEQRGKSHRYVKVSENIYDLDDLPVGAHLIVVHPDGGRYYETIAKFSAETGEVLRSHAPLPAEITLPLLKQWGFIYT